MIACAAGGIPYRNSSCFWLSDERLTWYQARDACRSLTAGGRLAVIPDNETYDFIVEHFDADIVAKSAFATAYIGGWLAYPWIWDNSK